MIEVSGLTRLYGNNAAVKDVSFSIGKGEIVGLLGHNGAGKTTIMKMMTGYLEPSFGTIAIDNLSIADHRRNIQARIGYLPENCPVYPEMTVADYLDYAATLHGIDTPERQSRVMAALTATDLAAKADQQISTLSRGYRQRVGVAMAILHHPSILILDEPTNGLDPNQILHMRELITSLSDEATVIISTHILQEVKAVCDRAIIIRNGMVALDVRLDELRADKKLLIDTDGAPDQALPLFNKYPGILSAKTLDSGDATTSYRYGLSLSNQGERRELAAGLARTIAQQNWNLYELRSETTDLESIFREISTSTGKEEQK